MFLRGVSVSGATTLYNDVIDGVEEEDDYDDVHGLQMDGDTLESCSFFHDFAHVPNRDERLVYINKLMADKKDGDWLVRYNEGKRRYVLSVRWQGSAKHFYIWNQPDGTLQLQANHPKFPNMMRLLNYYRTHILCKEACITLHKPICCELHGGDDSGPDEDDGYVVLAKELQQVGLGNQPSQTSLGS